MREFQSLNVAFDAVNASPMHWALGSAPLAVLEMPVPWPAPVRLPVCGDPSGLPVPEGGMGPEVC
jgi:hypothetical protein